MTYDQLVQLIAPDEHKELEMKKTTGELKDGMHSACAFLNSKGGWLIFGVTPTSLRIIGQQVTDNTQREIAQALHGLEPAVDVDVAYVDVPEYPGNKVIAMHFDEWVWGKEPSTFHGVPYYRCESVTEQMPREMFEDRLKAAKPHVFGWERQVAEGLKPDDLDEDRVRAAVRLGVERGRLAPTANGETVEQLMGKFKLKKDGKLTQGALMLFAKDTSDYPQLMLRMARFAGTDKNEFLDNQRANGNFFDLLDAGMQFAYKHLNLRGKIVGLQRIDKLEIPIEAMREALINAFCHRTYDSTGASVSLAIFDDRVEISNPGRLPNELTPENLLLPHDSYPTNPLVAETLFKTTYLDGWGSGVKRILDACDEDGVPHPHYEVRPGSVVVVFKRPDVVDNVLENVVDNVLNEKFKKLPERQQLIMRQMQLTATRNVLDNVLENVLETQETLADRFSVNERTIRRDLKVLQEEGFLRHEGPDHGGRYVILYM